jgi:hypothetical protein
MRKQIFLLFLSIAVLTVVGPKNSYASLKQLVYTEDQMIDEALKQVKPEEGGKIKQKILKLKKFLSNKANIKKVLNARFIALDREKPLEKKKIKGKVAKLKDLLYLKNHDRKDISKKEIIKIVALIVTFPLWIVPFLVIFWASSFGASFDW